MWGAATKPERVVLDPELTVSLPVALTARTGLDAFVHALEASTNVRRHAWNDLHAHAALWLIAGELEIPVFLYGMLADDPDQVVGVARCVRLEPGGDTAEFAIVVGDELQGEGLGSILATALADAARRVGIRRFSATTLAENEAAERLLDALATRLERNTLQGGGLRELVAVLPDRDSERLAA